VSKRHICLRVTTTDQCPLYLGDERVMLSLPEILRESSDRLCLPALAEMLPALSELQNDAPGAELPVMQCSGCQGGVASFKASRLLDSTRSGVIRDVAQTAEDRRTQGDDDRPPPFLSQLPTEAVKKLLSECRVRTFNEPTLIMREGESGRHLHIVGRGQVEVVKNAGTEDEMFLAVLGKGDCFGEMSLITGEPSSASVRTVGEDAAILSLDKDTVEALIERVPTVAVQFNRILSRRLRRANEELQVELSRAIGGRISASLSIGNVIQTLSQNNQTGRLVIQRKSEQGDAVDELVFRQGQVVDAKAGEIDGEEAVYEIMQLVDGKFTFQTDALPPPQKTISRNTTMLLMEGMRRIDEANRAASR
jgi:CRP-like cAMP-binding protein